MRMFQKVFKDHKYLDISFEPHISFFYSGIALCNDPLLTPNKEEELLKG